MIKRRDICKELNIDEKTLEQYLSFIAFPNLAQNEFEPELVQAIMKLDDLVEQGYSYDEIRNLIHCSEKFSASVPGLESFLGLSESTNLKTTIQNYHQTFNEFAQREEQYQERIQELEADLMTLKRELEKTEILEEQIMTFQQEFNKVQSQILEKDRHIAVLEDKLKELEIKNSSMCNKLDDHVEELNSIKNHIDDPQEIMIKSAIDIDALIKKKEKELSLKYQKEVLDLKKQVDMIIEDQEEKWLKRNLKPDLSSK